MLAARPPSRALWYLRLCPVCRWIAGMSDLLSVTLAERVHLRTTLYSHLWPALVDPTRFELVVLNPAINARAAMQSGGSLAIEMVNIVVEHEPSRPEEPSPGDYVCLTVNDTGVGIPSMYSRECSNLFHHERAGKRFWPRIGGSLRFRQTIGRCGMRIETPVGPR
jgi:hypothetical protein